METRVRSYRLIVTRQDCAVITRTPAIEASSLERAFHAFNDWIGPLEPKDASSPSSGTIHATSPFHPGSKWVIQSRRVTA